jgi:hypothetical protein
VWNQNVVQTRDETEKEEQARDHHQRACVRIFSLGVSHDFSL